MRRLLLCIVLFLVVISCTDEGDIITNVEADDPLATRVMIVEPTDYDTIQDSALFLVTFPEDWPIRGVNLYEGSGYTGTGAIGYNPVTPGSVEIRFIDNDRFHHGSLLTIRAVCSFFDSDTLCPSKPVLVYFDRGE